MALTPYVPSTLPGETVQVLIPADSRVVTA